MKLALEINTTESLKQTSVPFGDLHPITAQGAYH